MPGIVLLKALLRFAALPRSGAVAIERSYILACTWVLVAEVCSGL